MVCWKVWVLAHISNHDPETLRWTRSDKVYNSYTDNRCSFPIEHNALAYEELNTVALHCEHMSDGPSSHCTSRWLNGSPKAACATAEVSSKKLTGHTPFVRLMICVGSANMPGGISPCREPTALNLRRARTPRDLSAAMFAGRGT
jgi:hypothetical protein